ncbi:calcium-binding protein [Paracoccus sp. (in: a-proteobacteria)]|uniref:calcium-binding protein n=1 Tax=Paracoccus sp. TaxID=267 RepID=UPI003A85EB09
MARVTAAHFGLNSILTLDSAKDGTAFTQMVDELSVANLRYPGGGVTEDQTWQNGGLARMFGAPMEPGDPDYIMTLRELLAQAVRQNASVTIVIPTFQFLDDTAHFRQAEFGRYMTALKDTLADMPEVRIRAFEIGNEYWASLSAAEYGYVANKEIPALARLADQLAGSGGGAAPLIGLQAGAQWRASGADESRQIAAQISMANRAHVGEITQHVYPDPQVGQMAQQRDMAVGAMKEYLGIRGFSHDLELELTEFNIARTAGARMVFGVNQASLWIEEFAHYVNAGIDAIDVWGGGYKWLSTKLYDTQMPEGEMRGGQVVTIATPMGQVFDLASAHLVGTRVLSDKAAVAGLGVASGLGVTGFAGHDERIVFVSNMTSAAETIDLGGLKGSHVALHHIIPADSPHSTWYDERTMVVEQPDGVVDARGDMKVTSGAAAGGAVLLKPNELLMVIVSDPDRALLLEGAHNVTDYRTHMVDDILVGARGNDRLYGHVGDDLLVGNAGRDSLWGGLDDDTLRGGAGSDRLFGGAGADRLIGGRHNDQIFGEDGADVLRSSFGSDLLDGGNGDDRIIGWTGNDRLFGQAGDDRLFGGGGNDRLIAGPGNDQLWGGSGADEFVFADHDGRNIIHDFDPDADRLTFQGDDDPWIAQSGDSAIIHYGETYIVLQHVDGTDLQGLIG